MAYHVRVAPAALRDAEEAYEWMKENISEAYATKWYNGLVDTVYSLDEFPGRGSLAPESEELGAAIRQILYGKRSATYRILYTIFGSHSLHNIRR